MGRKMSIRGRPGLLFLALVVVFIIVFILSWRSIRPEKQQVKDIYSSYSSVNVDALRRREQGMEMQHSLNDLQNAGKGTYNQENVDKDLQYQLGKDFLIERVKMDEKMNSADANSKKIDESPLSAILHSEKSKQPKTFTNDQNCKSTPEMPPFYHEVNPSSSSILDSLQRFVHLDLKGAPPKLNFLRELFPLLTKIGATGLFIEYEDMFPYSGSLRNISAINSYTAQEIEELLVLARKNRLTVVPLIQTFGHMEFVLKSVHLKGLRESEYTPQVLNVASNKSYEVVRDLVKQILAAHPSVSYLHIGCDEVYELGRGQSANIMIRERVGKEEVFLRHVKRVAQIVAEESKGKVRPIMWDDELRSIPEDIILKSQLPSLVDIMVWKYTPNISKSLNETIWKKYGKLFKNVWTASSFKGATGARQLYTEPQYHIQNHFSWIETFVKYKDIVNFKGMVLTGWSRFDHFATLCELFPVAIPSLAVCLATLKNGGFNKEIHKATSTELNCSDLIEMTFPEIDPKTKRAKVTQDCRFPGYMLYYGMQQLWGTRQQGQEAKEAGWLSEYHMSHRFSNPGQLKYMSMKLSEQHSNFIQVSTSLQKELSTIYSDDTVEEWMDENINEQIHHIKDIQEKIKTLLAHIHWERRPLKTAVNLPANVEFDEVPIRIKTRQENSISINRERKQQAVTKPLEMRRDVIDNVPKQSLPIGQINNPIQGKLGSNVFVQKGIENIKNSLDKVNNFNEVKKSGISPAFGGKQSDLSNPQAKTLLKVESNRQKMQHTFSADQGLSQLRTSSFRNKGEFQKVIKSGVDIKTKVFNDSKLSAQANFPQQHNLGRSNTNAFLGKPKSIPEEDVHNNSITFKDIHAEKKKLDEENQNLIDKLKNVREDNFHKMNSQIEHVDDFIKPLDERRRKLPKEKEYDPQQDNVMIDSDDFEELDTGKGKPGTKDDIMKQQDKKISENEPGLDHYGLTVKDKGGLSPEFVEALRKSHYAMSNQDAINKELFPHLEQDSKEDRM